VIRYWARGQTQSTGIIALRTTYRYDAGVSTPEHEVIPSLCFFVRIAVVERWLYVDGHFCAPGAHGSFGPIHISFT
jgi:hypothetical protein